MSKQTPAQKRAQHNYYQNHKEQKVLYAKTPKGRAAAKRAQRKHYLTHKEQINKWHNAYRKTERGRAVSKKASMKHRLKKVYGLTLAQRDQLFALQRNRCKCCSSPMPGSVVGWHIDHDHKTGIVRGILCHHCNAIAGMADDNVE